LFWLGHALSEKGGWLSRIFAPIAAAGATKPRPDARTQDLTERLHARCAPAARKTKKARVSGLSDGSDQREPAARAVSDQAHSHSIINSFGKSLSGLMLASQRLTFTVILTVILTGIPKRSIHHQSTSI